MRFRLLFLLFFSFRAVAQNADIDLHYANEINTDTLQKTLLVLASDSLQGRESGRTGQKLAAAYLKSVYESRGIPTFQQNHPLNRKTNTAFSMIINDQYFIYYEDYYYYSALPDTVLNLNEIVFSGFGIQSSDYNDFNYTDLEGKSLLVSFTKPEWKKKKSKSFSAPTQQIDLLTYIKSVAGQKPGFLFIAVKDLYQTSLTVQGSFELQKYLQSPPCPIVFINEKAAQRFFGDDDKPVFTDLLTRIEKKCKPKTQAIASRVTIGLKYDTKYLLGDNIMAKIEGSDPNAPAIFISAHYDHLGKRDTLIFHGADDNASGTSAVLEMARVFKKAKDEGHTPLRTLIFLDVSGEEKGLLGSSFYVKHPMWPLEKTMVDLNIDMIGRIDEKYDSLKNGNYVYVIGSDKLSKDLYNIVDSANLRGDQLILDYKYDSPDDPNRFYQRSDHYNFAKNNIPVAFFFNGTHEDYHQPTDTADKIHFDLIQKRTRLVFLTAWHLANRPRPIRLDSVGVR